jgi:hypothetical protein
MTKVLSILAGCILLLVLAGAFVYFLIGASIDETYSPSWTSYSIDEAKKDHIFISQPDLENTVIELDGFKYPIREVWIEQSTRVEYKWIFIRQRISTGFRLMLTLTVPYDSPEDHNLINQAGRTFPICNDSIWLTTIVPAARKDMWKFYGQVSEPFPQSVQLTLKVYSKSAN